MRRIIGTCRMSKSRLTRLHPWLAAAAFAVAAFLVYRALQQYTLSEIWESLGEISLRHLALGLAFTAASFVCLTGSDALAVRYTENDLAYPKIALASFTSVSLGHTLGFAVFSSGAVRYRFYTGWGLSAGDVARIIVFCGVTVTLGLATAGGLASLIRPALVAETFGIAPAAVVFVGVVLLLVVGIYLGLAACPAPADPYSELRAAGADTSSGAGSDRGRDDRPAAGLGRAASNAQGHQ
jgi:uncharacterized membrane protein YbhN (UPF0104 family)